MLYFDFIDCIYERSIYDVLRTYFTANLDVPYLVGVTVVFIVMVLEKYYSLLNLMTIWPIHISTKWKTVTPDFITEMISSVVSILDTYSAYLPSIPSATTWQFPTNGIIFKSNRDVINDVLHSVSSKQTIPSSIKTLDVAILILEIARAADPTLSSSPVVDNFFLFMSEVAVNSSRISRQGFGDVKVLCIEGLARSGKSTLVQGLVSRAGALVVTPLEPSNLKEVRQLFSESPEPVTTALEFALNYCTAYRIITATTTAAATTTTTTAATAGVTATTTSTGTSTSAIGTRTAITRTSPTHRTSPPARKQLVVVDELYHRTCAHTVSTNVGSEVDPKSLPASAFEWPLDLPIPALVIFLSLSSSYRSKRLSKAPQVSPAASPKRPVGSRFHWEQGSPMSSPGKKNILGNFLEKKEDFPGWSNEDDRAVLCYSLITGPPTIALDASQSAEEVLNSALEACEEFALCSFPPAARRNFSKRISMGVYGELAKF